MKMVEEERCRSAFYHYIHIGAKEGYSPNSDFDEGYYIQANQDVKETVEKGDIRCGYHHFLVYGEMEGRTPRPISLEESDARQALIAIFNETNT